LVKLAEKNAREREKRDQEIRENKAALALTNNQIQVKPLIETVPPDEKKTPSARSSHAKISNDVHNTNKADDLLRLITSENKINIKLLLSIRFTPPPDPQTLHVSNSENKFPVPSTPNEIPAKLQQMNGPSGPVRKSAKAKW
jgi:hypothetical protein